MTFYQAVSEAKYRATLFGIPYEVYSFRIHWWWFRQYEFKIARSIFWEYPSNYRIELVIQSDGKTH